MGKPNPGGQARPLGLYGNRATGPGQRAFRRSERMDVLKPAQRLLTGSVSSRLCFLSAGGDVSVEITRELVAHVCGVRHCGSPWACPICAPVVRERRAREIDEGVSAALGLGWSALFLTQTVRHHGGDRLAPRLAVMSKALWHVTQGRPWKRLASDLGYAGAIKAIDITHGSNGWHPHSHSVLLFRESLDAAAVEAVRSHVFGAWDRAVRRRGFGSLSDAHGVDLRPVVDAGGLSEYLTKVDGGWGVGLELARSDLKSKGVAPVGLLRRAALDGDADAARLWREYERATFGKRAVVWSPGLRGRLLPEVAEVTDEEAARAEGAGVVLVRVQFSGEEWSAYVRAGEVGELLRQLEQWAALSDALCSLRPGSVVDGRMKVA